MASSVRFTTRYEILLLTIPALEPPTMGVQDVSTYLFPRIQTTNRIASNPIQGEPDRFPQNDSLGQLLFYPSIPQFPR